MPKHYICVICIKIFYINYMYAKLNMLKKVTLIEWSRKYIDLDENICNALETTQLLHNKSIKSL